MPAAAGRLGAVDGGRGGHRCVVGLPRCVLGLLSAPSVLPARAWVARSGNNSDSSVQSFQLGAGFMGGVAGLALWVPVDGSALHESRRGPKISNLVGH